MHLSFSPSVQDVLISRWSQYSDKNPKFKKNVEAYTVDFNINGSPDQTALEKCLFGSLVSLDNKQAWLDTIYFYQRNILDAELSNRNANSKYLESFLRLIEDAGTNKVPELNINDAIVRAHCDELRAHAITPPGEYANAIFDNLNSKNVSFDKSFMNEFYVELCNAWVSPTFENKSKILNNMKIFFKESKVLTIEESLIIVSFSNLIEVLLGDEQLNNKVKQILEFMDPDKTVFSESKKPIDLSGIQLSK